MGADLAALAKSKGLAAQGNAGAEYAFTPALSAFGGYSYVFGGFVVAGNRPAPRL
jgi:hypothetical protein